jgi:RNA polymerase primary sigma factor
MIFLFSFFILAGFEAKSFGINKCLDYLLIGELSPLLAQLLSNSPDNELLTKEEERELLLQKARGFAAQEQIKTLSEEDPNRKELLFTIAKGEDARAELILANLRLVAHIARGFRNRGLPFEDLVSEGNLGLIRAIDDLEFEARLSTYAVYWIREAIFSALIKSGSTIRMSAHMAPLITRFRRMEKSLTLSQGKQPTFEEVAKELELKNEQAELLRRALRSQRVKNFQDLAIEDQSEAELGFLATNVDPGLNLANQEESQKLQNAIDQLRKIDLRLPAIIRLRFLDGKTLDETGSELGITRERTRQLQSRGLQELKKLFSKKSSQ